MTEPQDDALDTYTVDGPNGPIEVQLTAEDAKARGGRKVEASEATPPAEPEPEATTGSKATTPKNKSVPPANK